MDPLSLGLGAIATAGLSIKTPEVLSRLGKTIGWYLEPWQIKRIAEAKARGEAEGDVAKLEIYERAGMRFLGEQLKRQKNLEDITAKALPLVSDSAQPDKVSDDWINDFYDKCALISSVEMQQIWSKILAGELNHPGTFSKRTLSVVENLSSEEAEGFEILCRFFTDFGPVVFDFESKIYTDNGLTFDLILILKNAGLVEMEMVGGFTRIQLPHPFFMSYNERTIVIFKTKNPLDRGKVVLTKCGKQLSSICKFSPVDNFFDFLLSKWFTHEAYELKKVSTDDAFATMRQVNSSGKEVISPVTVEQYNAIALRFGLPPMPSV